MGLALFGAGREPEVTGSRRETHTASPNRKESVPTTLGCHMDGSRQGGPNHWAGKEGASAPRFCPASSTQCQPGPLLTALPPLSDSYFLSLFQPLALRQHREPARWTSFPTAPAPPLRPLAHPARHPQLSSLLPCLPSNIRFSQEGGPVPGVPCSLTLESGIWPRRGGTLSPFQNSLPARVLF